MQTNKRLTDGRKKIVHWHSECEKYYWDSDACILSLLLFHVAEGNKNASTICSVLVSQLPIGNKNCVKQKCNQLYVCLIKYLLTRLYFYYVIT